MTCEHLFKPLRVGRIELPNRIGMPPMARYRCTTEGVPTDLVETYFAQRATAGLITADSVYVDVRGRMGPHLGGLTSDEQQEGWARVARAVHDRGGRIFIQLIHAGRVSHPDLQPDGGPTWAPSAIMPRPAFSQVLAPTLPRALEVADIKELIHRFADAAGRAVDAGFDGLELHGANGYLISQFLAPCTNQRTDAYGGPPEKRSRFALEVIDAVSEAIGADRVGIKLSPGGEYHDMHDSDQDVIETHTYLLRELDKRNIQHVHVQMPFAAFDSMHNIGFDQCGLVRDHFSGVLFASGGLDRTSGNDGVKQGRFDVAMYGTRYIANPDLVTRFAQDAPENEVDWTTLDTTGPEGYIDYPQMQVPRH